MIGPGVGTAVIVGVSDSVGMGVAVKVNVNDDVAVGVLVSVSVEVGVSVEVRNGVSVGVSPGVEVSVVRRMVVAVSTGVGGEEIVGSHGIGLQAEDSRVPSIKRQRLPIFTL